MRVRIPFLIFNRAILPCPRHTKPFDAAHPGLGVNGRISLAPQSPFMGQPVNGHVALTIAADSDCLKETARHQSVDCPGDGTAHWWRFNSLAEKFSNCGMGNRYLVPVHRIPGVPGGFLCVLQVFPPGEHKQADFFFRAGEGTERITLNELIDDVCSLFASGPS